MIFYNYKMFLFAITLKHNFLAEGVKVQAFFEGECDIVIGQ